MGSRVTTPFLKSPSWTERRPKRRREFPLPPEMSSDGGRFALLHLFEELPRRPLWTAVDRPLDPMVGLVYLRKWVLRTGQARDERSTRWVLSRCDLREDRRDAA